MEDDEIDAENDLLDFEDSLVDEEAADDNSDGKGSSSDIEIDYETRSEISGDDDDYTGDVENLVHNHDGKLHHDSSEEKEKPFERAKAATFAAKDAAVATEPVNSTATSRKTKRTSIDSKDVQNIVKKSRKAEPNSEEKEELLKILRDARFFLMKTSDVNNLKVSQDNKVWFTDPQNVTVLDNAMKTCKNIILIFSAKWTGCFSGFALVTGRSKSDDPPRDWAPSVKTLGGLFHVKWLSKNELLFSFSSHLKNPANGKQLSFSADGQEIEGKLGMTLCQLVMDKGVELEPADPKCKPLCKKEPKKISSSQELPDEAKLGRSSRKGSHERDLTSSRSNTLQEGSQTRNSSGIQSGSRIRPDPHVRNRTRTHSRSRACSGTRTRSRSRACSGTQTQSRSRACSGTRTQSRSRVLSTRRTQVEGNKLPNRGRSSSDLVHRSRRRATSAVRQKSESSPGRNSPNKKRTTVRERLQSRESPGKGRRLHESKYKSLEELQKYDSVQRNDYLDQPHNEIDGYESYLSDDYFVGEESPLPSKRKLHGYQTDDSIELIVDETMDSKSSGRLVIERSPIREPLGDPESDDVMSENGFDVSQRYRTSSERTVYETARTSDGVSKAPRIVFETRSSQYSVSIQDDILRETRLSPNNLLDSTSENFSDTRNRSPTHRRSRVVTVAKSYPSRREPAIRTRSTSRRRSVSSQHVPANRESLLDGKKLASFEKHSSYDSSKSPRYGASQSRNRGDSRSPKARSLNSRERKDVYQTSGIVVSPTSNRTETSRKRHLSQDSKNTFESSRPTERSQVDHLDVKSRRYERPKTERSPVDHLDVKSRRYERPKTERSPVDHLDIKSRRYQRPKTERSPVDHLDIKSRRYERSPKTERSPVDHLNIKSRRYERSPKTVSVNGSYQEGPRSRVRSDVEPKDSLYKNHEDKPRITRDKVYSPVRTNRASSPAKLTNERNKTAKESVESYAHLERFDDKMKLTKDQHSSFNSMRRLTDRDDSKDKLNRTDGKDENFRQLQYEGVRNKTEIEHRNASKSDYRRPEGKRTDTAGVHRSAPLESMKMNYRFPGEGHQHSNREDDRSSKDRSRRCDSRSHNRPSVASMVDDRSSSHTQPPIDRRDNRQYSDDVDDRNIRSKGQEYPVERAHRRDGLMTRDSIDRRQIPAETRSVRYRSPESRKEIRDSGEENLSRRNERMASKPENRSENFGRPSIGSTDLPHRSSEIRSGHHYLEHGVERNTVGKDQRNTSEAYKASVPLSSTSRDHGRHTVDSSNLRCRSPNASDNRYHSERLDGTNKSRYEQQYATGVGHSGVQNTSKDRQVPINHGNTHYRSSDGRSSRHYSSDRRDDKKNSSWDGLSDRGGSRVLVAKPLDHGQSSGESSNKRIRSPDSRHNSDNRRDSNRGRYESRSSCHSGVPQTDPPREVVSSGRSRHLSDRRDDRNNSRREASSNSRRRSTDHPTHPFGHQLPQATPLVPENCVIGAPPPPVLSQVSSKQFTSTILPPVAAFNPSVKPPALLPTPSKYVDVSPNTAPYYHPQNVHPLIPNIQKVPQIWSQGPMIHHKAPSISAEEFIRQCNSIQSTHSSSTSIDVSRGRKKPSDMNQMYMM